MCYKEHLVAAFIHQNHMDEAAQARLIAIGRPSRERRPARLAIAQCARAVRSSLAALAFVAFGNHLN
jgi:hypothetical protein